MGQRAPLERRHCADEVPLVRPFRRRPVPELFSQGYGLASDERCALLGGTGRELSVLTAQASLEVPATDQPAWNTGPNFLTVSAPQLRARVSRPHQDALVVSVDGDVDAATVEHLQEVLWPRLSATVDKLVIELAGVDFLGVAGLQLLHQAHLSAQSRGLVLALVLDGGEAERAVHVAGLDEDLPCFSTAEHALRALDGQSCATNHVDR